MYDPLCELSDVKEWLGAKPADKINDDDLDWLIQSCSDQIGRLCGRDNLGTVGSYTENYRLQHAAQKQLMLRHYPVTALTGVLVANTPQTILTAQMLQAGNTQGIFLEDDNRTLSFFEGWNARNGFNSVSGYILVNYSAGYDLASNGVPFGLRQAAIQFVGEVFRSAGWIGYKSKSLAGETTSFEGGAQWGMSPRTKSMLQPYVNRVPVYQ